MVFRVGLLINPLAGLGGTVALKGSDGQAVVREALLRGAHPQVEARCEAALAPVFTQRAQLAFITWGGAMGADLLGRLGFAYQIAGAPHTLPSSAVDTRRAVSLMSPAVDLLLFAGGDGTARDVLDGGAGRTPVLGIPAGVKMHSGVFAVTPGAVGEMLQLLLRGELVDLRPGEVRDIDEAALREGCVRASYYGDLMVPQEGRFVQHVKQGGREVEELVVQEMAEGLAEDLEDDVLYIVGPGTTTAALMQQLQLPATLLGIDLFRGGEIVKNDATEAEILQQLALCGDEACLIVGVSGGQGSLFGRGNQQLSPEVITTVGLDRLLILATKTKISALEGRPLLVDTGDAALDLALRGYHTVITGYRDQILYPVNSNLAPLPQVGEDAGGSQ